MPVRELTQQDVAERATAVARRTGAGTEVVEVRPLDGGVSSLTYAARLLAPEADRPVVLKVAPPGLPPVRNRDVLRQARVLDRLAGLDGFPVPAVLLRDAGDPPEVPPMFAMELRPGQAYEPLLDVAERPPAAAEVAARERALARALARLQSRTPEQLGLGDEPVQPVREELDRWERLFATVEPDIAVGHEALGERLARRVPPATAPRLVHGDYRAANALFVGPDLSAVIDWEIWSVGDPRPDLAWVLLHADPPHVFHLHRPLADREAGRGVPSAGELLETYLSARSQLGATQAELRAVSADLAWFLAVAHYKVASTIAAIWKRERRRPEPDAKLVVASARLEQVLERGHAALDAAPA